MGVAVHDKVIVREVLRKVLFLVCHVDVAAVQLEIEEHGDVFGPVFVVVAADHIYGSDGVQLVDDVLAVYVASVEDGFAALKSPDHLRSEETVCI